MIDILQLLAACAVQTVPCGLVAMICILDCAVIGSSGRVPQDMH
jgi:hypothetical protein